MQKCWSRSKVNILLAIFAGTRKAKKQWWAKESHAVQSTHGYISQETNQPAGGSATPYLANRRGSPSCVGETSPAASCESWREQASAGSTLLPWHSEAGQGQCKCEIKGGKDWRERWRWVTQRRW